MTSNWKTVSFGDIAEVLPGEYIPKSEYVSSGGFTIYGSNSIMGLAPKPLYEGPIIAFARIGSNCGATMFSSRACWINNNAAGIRARPPHDTRFLYYWMQGFDFARIREGSGQPYISNSTLNDQEVYLPPLLEQRAIAGVLGALDDKIELNRRMNETLEAIAKAEFRRMKEEGGETKTVGEIAEINSWTLGKNDELDRIEYVEISEVSRGNIANLQIFERGKEPSRARRRLRHGDTVLSTVRPERGSYFLCLNPSPNLIASTGFAVVTPTKAPWSYVHAALTQPETFEQLGHLADGGAYPAIRPEVIEAWEIPWPDDAGKLEDFHRKCAPLYERAEHNRRESRTLAGLRDALLPKLLSGAVRVKAAMDEHGRTR
jgi:type I restriction enzyme S subunit